MILLRIALGLGAAVLLHSVLFAPRPVKSAVRARRGR